MRHFKGLVAPTFTPMSSDGSLDLSPIERLAESHLADGICGAFVCGSTGESTSLTVDERKQVAERWQTVAGAELPVIVHVGHNALPAAKEMAAHAQRIGAAAVAAMAPCYFRPSDVEDLVVWCSEIASAAPGLPFYYYHIPSRTGVYVKLAEFLARGCERIPNLAGAKFTFEDLFDLGQCLDLDDGRFEMLFGRDEMLLAGYAIGVEGAVGTTYNFAAPLYHELIAAFKAGDMAAAQARQAQSREMITAMLSFPGMGACKAMMGMVGVDCGPVRLPNRNLTPEQVKALRGELEAVGFFEYCSKG